MTSSPLDVEAQLRAWQKANEKKAPESFMKWENLEFTLPLIIPLITVTIITCFIILVIPFIGRNKLLSKSNKPSTGLAQRYAINLVNTHAVFFASKFNPILFSTYLVIWLLLCAINAVFKLMQAVSNDSNFIIILEEKNSGFMHIAIILYVIQYWGITSLLIHILFTAERYYIGSILSLLPFLVNFYQTTSLKGDEVDQLPIFVLNLAFLFSILPLLAFTIPWVKNEYRIAMRDLNTHTSTVLGYRKKVKESREDKKRS